MNDKKLTISLQTRDSDFSVHQRELRIMKLFIVKDYFIVVLLNLLSYSINGGLKVYNGWKAQAHKTMKSRDLTYI